MSHYLYSYPPLNAIPRTTTYAHTHTLTHSHTHSHTHILCFFSAVNWQVSLAECVYITNMVSKNRTDKPISKTACLTHPTPQPAILIEHCDRPTTALLNNSAMPLTLHKYNTIIYECVRDPLCGPRTPLWHVLITTNQIRHMNYCWESLAEEL